MNTEQTTKHLITSQAGIITGCSCGFRTVLRGAVARLDEVKEHIRQQAPILPDDDQADEDAPLVTDAYDMEGRA